MKNKERKEKEIRPRVRVLNHGGFNCGRGVNVILLSMIPASVVGINDNPLIAKVFCSYQYRVISNRQVMLCI